MLQSVDLGGFPLLAFWKSYIGVLEGVDLALMQHFKKGSKLLVLCVEGFGLQ